MWMSRSYYKTQICIIFELIRVCNTQKKKIILTCHVYSKWNITLFVCILQVRNSQESPPCSNHIHSISETLRLMNLHCIDILYSYWYRNGDRWTILSDPAKEEKKKCCQDRIKQTSRKVSRYHRDKQTP